MLDGLRRIPRVLPEEVEMSLAPNRLALIILCVLPAFAVNVGHRDSPLLATFMYACDADHPEPRLTTVYTGEGKAKPKAASDPVALFDAGQEPARHYRVIGEVKVLANSHETSVDDLKTWAARGARKLGGDALVAVRCDDAASMTPQAGPVGLLALTATVAQWE